MVTVSSEATGKVRIRVDGRVIRTITATSGKAKSRLPNLRVGKHRIRAKFLGTDSLKSSASKRVTILVIRNRR